MTGFLKDLTYARSGEYILSIYTRESCKDLWKNFHCEKSRSSWASRQQLRMGAH